MAEEVEGVAAVPGAEDVGLVMTGAAGVVRMAVVDVEEEESEAAGEATEGTMEAVVVVAIDPEQSVPSTVLWSLAYRTPVPGKISRTICVRRATCALRTHTRMALEWWSSCAVTT